MTTSEPHVLGRLRALAASDRTLAFGAVQHAEAAELVAFVDALIAERDAHAARNAYGPAGDAKSGNEILRRAAKLTSAPALTVRHLLMDTWWQLSADGLESVHCVDALAGERPLWRYVAGHLHEQGWPMTPRGLRLAELKAKEDAALVERYQAEEAKREGGAT